MSRPLLNGMWIGAVIMKKKSKKAAALLLVLSIVLSAGCTKKQVDNVVGTPKTDYIYDKEIAQTGKGSKVAFSEKGYYHLINGILYFYDINSAVEAPVCSKTDCLHNSSSCNAYVYDYEGYDPLDLTGISVNGAGNHIWYDEGKLYLIHRDESGDYLMQYDSDFTNEVRLCTLAEKGTVVGLADGSASTGACMYNGYLYYFSVKPVNAGTLEDFMMTAYCNRIKVAKDSKVEVLGSIDAPADYAFLGGAGRVFAGKDCVYFVSGGNKRWFGKNNQVQYRICSYDCINEKFSIQFNKNADEYKDFLGSGTGGAPCIDGSNICADDENNIYIVTLENKVVKMTPGGSISIIYSSDAGEIGRIMWDGTYIYLSECGKRGSIVRLDKEGNSKGRYDIVINEEFREQMNIRGTMSVSFGIYGIDAQNILIRTRQEDIKGLEFERLTLPRDIQNGKNRYSTCAVGIISKNAFDDPSMPIQSIYIYE